MNIMYVGCILLKVKGIQIRNTVMLILLDNFNRLNITIYSHGAETLLRSPI